jgi:mannose-1-phosphate guanylyltransferase
MDSDSGFPGRGDRVKVISEPEGRNTAACMTYAATIARRSAPGAVMAFLPADHFIRKTGAFVSALEAGLDFAEKQDVILTMGVKPSRPSTGFGYVRRGAFAGKAGRFRVYRARAFTEKPSERKARAYIRTGRYSWNAGIFISKASVLLEEVSCYLPAVARPFGALAASLGGPRERRARSRCYAVLPGISIDFGVMEKTGRACVMPVDIGWDDVGNWDSFAKLMRHDGKRNSVSGPHAAIDTTGCVIFSEGSLVATVGVEDLVIVAVGDAVLVARRAEAERVKDLSRLLENRGLEELL